MDYRLAPKAQHPELLHDVINAYIWTLNYVKKVIGTSIEHITFMGDSAGGSLIVALTFWLIENEQRLPDLVMPCYGALSLDKSEFYSSTYLGLEEFFLHYSALNAVRNFYVPKDHTELSEDHYVNAFKAPKEILRKMPTTKIFCGLYDPVRDPQIAFARELQRLGVDTELNCFEHLPHGVLTNR